MRVTIITATYNAEATIADALVSIRAQTYKDIEHIVIDGGSTDLTSNIIQRFHHPGLKLISEKDEGLYYALNKGIKKATGDIIGFLHSDDLLPTHDVIHRIVSEFERYAPDAVYSDLEYVKKDDITQVIRHWTAGEFHLKNLKNGWMPPHPTLYFRKSALERLVGFDTSFRISADYDLILRYFLDPSATYRYIPKVLYKMRMGGISNRGIKNICIKMAEDISVVRKNKVGGAKTIFLKNILKLKQFKIRA